MHKGAAAVAHDSSDRIVIHLESVQAEDDQNFICASPVDEGDDQVVHGPLLARGSTSFLPKAEAALPSLLLKKVYVNFLTWSGWSFVWTLWNCNILRDDRPSYQGGIEQLAFLLFLKMADDWQKLSLKANWTGQIILAN